MKDFRIIKGPHITEKSMQPIDGKNTYVFKVCGCANKTSVKLAFERIYKVKVLKVNVVNVRAKDTTRGGRYQGKIGGFKKAVITTKDPITLYEE